MAMTSYRAYRARTRASCIACFASTSSLTSAAAVVNRTRRFCRQAATQRPVSRWVFPVPQAPRDRMPLALVDFRGEQGFQVAEVRVPLAHGLLGQRPTLAADGRQVQHFAVLEDRSQLQ